MRKTEPLTGQEQLKTFHLPAGFEIQLVAADPEIGKPMNMAFDAKGRLWLTQSREYPFPVALDKKGRDKIMVLEDFDENGRAKKITTFAEGLNIPIGLYPYKNGCIAYSIPNVYYFEDTDGDGRSDKETVLLSRFGYEKDTHGMTGSFRRGYDGWLYADHGFNNDSTLRASDGSEIKLNSGNVYRWKIDGSHVEQFTWGQVNPFGLAFDHLGDLWSTDCHSSPVYQLLRGAYYPSFGKPHDGLGFAPNICAHSHGSTAIAGMVFYDDDKFPQEFRHNTYIGNVMTCRINRDSFIQKGSTRIAKEEPDLLTCDDPWFRPVDLQLGPDGAIWIADFYNRIIGHYEVPLDHPGRDRERGRIWRVVYKGIAEDVVVKVGEEKVKKKTPSPAKSVPVLETLIKDLGHPNLTRRNLAMNAIVDEQGEKAIPALRRALNAAGIRPGKAEMWKPGTKLDDLWGTKVGNLLWALHRLDALDASLGETSIAPNRLVRVHTMRILAERGFGPAGNSEGFIKKDRVEEVLRKVLIRGLSDPDAHVQRAAADALGRHPSAEGLLALQKFVSGVPAEDAQLLHTARMALRNQLLPSENFATLLKTDLSEAGSRAIADIAVGVKNPEAGLFLLKHIQAFSEEREKLSGYLRHAARYAPESKVSEIAKFTRTKFADDIDFQLALFKSVQEGTQQRGAKLDAAAIDWGTELAERLLISVDPKTLDWSNTPIKGDDTTNPWFIEERPSADGKRTKVVSSFSPGGERFTGILRSKPFALPAKLTFYLCGHDGSPEKPARNKNLIRLRDADSKKVLAEQHPPRNDTAQKITWDLSKYAGANGYLEIVDGNTGSSYAWIGVGRFEPEVVPMPKLIPNQVAKRQLSAAEMVETLRLAKLEPKLAELLQNPNSDVDARAAAAKTLATLNGASHINTLGDITANPDEQVKLREKSAQALATVNSAEARARLLEIIRTAPQRLQTQIALALASNGDGAEALLQAVEDGKLSANVLQEKSVKDRLGASKPKNVEARLEKLTKNLTPISEEKQKLIDQRRLAFGAAESSAERGLKVFETACAICHQLDGKGALVGPQLDGVGNRGADRLIEDILDPNRNVDAAFRYSNVTLKDDQVVSGLFRREEGEILIFADATGKEISVAKKDIAERKESENSLMPENVSEIISEQDLNDLIAFLLTKGSKPTAQAK